MADLNREQRENLPYGEHNPATSTDLVREMRVHAAMVAAVVAAKGKGALALLDDGTEEPGRSVVIQEVRVALALESLLGSEQEFILKTVLDGFTEPLLEQLANMHDRLHD